jgi:hypothetical protein
MIGICFDSFSSCERVSHPDKISMAFWKDVRDESKSLK